MKENSTCLGGVVVVVVLGGMRMGGYLSTVLQSACKDKSSLAVPFVVAFSPHHKHIDPWYTMNGYKDLYVME